MLLDRYIKETEASEEVKTSYLVPSKLVIEIYDIIKKNQMHKWSEYENSVSIDGARTVFKFWAGKQYVRVCSDEIPPDGFEILKSIRSLIQNYLKDEYLI